MIQLLHWLYLEAVSVQREIYGAFANRIGTYAETGDWTQLVGFLPLGIVFGVVHALTPGHSKTLLAAHTAAMPGNVHRALATAFILSVVHVSISVVIVLLSLPLVSSTLGSAGRAPLLEGMSRILIGIVGIWMIWIALRPGHVHAQEHESRAFAVFAGLIPCPLTFFVMTFAVARGVTEAGLAFAAVMLVGVFLTLGTLAAVTVYFRQNLAGLAGKETQIALTLGRLLQAIVGVGFLLLAIVTVAKG